MSLYEVTTFEWLADWDRDASYDHALSNISAYVLSCSYRTGSDAPFKEIAAPARMVLTLDNSTGAWSVEKTGATMENVFKKGVLIKMSFNANILNETTFAVTGTFQTTWFIGTITQLVLSTGVRGEQIAALTVEDPMLLLQDTEYHPPLLTDVTTDQAIAELFDEGAIAYPYPHRYWLLDVPGASELETTTTLFNHTITNFDTGQTTLAYSGDQADGQGTGISCRSFIADIVASEAGGRFYWNAQTGKFVFLNRYYVSEYDDTTIPFFTADSVVLDPTPPVYRYSDDLVNVIELSYQIRKVGNSAEILFTSTNVPISISAGATRPFRARYVDPDVPTARVGGLNMINPAPGVDYVANTASDGGGTDVTTSMGVSVQFSANSASVSITNPTAATAYITTFQLRGTKLSSYAQETALQLDGTSIYNYGKHSRAMQIPVVQSQEFASDYARSIVSRFSVPIARYERVTRNMMARTSDSGGLLPLILGRTVGSVVYYRDDHLDSNGYVSYLIVGDEGTITPGYAGGAWDSTWILEPVSQATYWALDVGGRSELDQTTILAL